MKNNRVVSDEPVSQQYTGGRIYPYSIFQLPRQLPCIIREHRTSILPDSGGNLLPAEGNAYKAGEHFADNVS